MNSEGMDRFAEMAIRRRELTKKVIDLENEIKEVESERDGVCRKMADMLDLKFEPFDKNDPGTFPVDLTNEYLVILEYIGNRAYKLAKWDSISNEWDVYDGNNNIVIDYRMLEPVSMAVIRS